MDLERKQTSIFCFSWKSDLIHSILFLFQVDFEVAGAEVAVVEDLEVVADMEDVVEEASGVEEVVADVDSEVGPCSMLKSFLFFYMCNDATIVIVSL